MKLFIKKPIKQLMAASAETEKSLKRTLGVGSLIALGIGAIIGAGIFVRTAAAAGEHAGPAVTISFLIAAAGCALSRFMLRRVCQYDPYCRIGLYLQLRHHGRVYCLDHRLGFGIGIRFGCRHSFHWLGAVF
jgi:hypothetical protein